MITKHVKRLTATLLVFALASPLLGLPTSLAQEKGARIFITLVPPAGGGGESPINPISGSVHGVDPKNYRVVVYAFADNAVWYVQPTTASPLTGIGTDGTWVTATHPGRLYAALLVKSSFVPPATTNGLPPISEDVSASITVPGKS